MNAGSKILRTAWVVPMDRPAIRDGAVVVRNGRIAAVGPRPDIAKEHAGVPIHDLGDSTLLPGLVNAHTHLELSDCRCGPPPTEGFAGWLVGMLRRTRITPEQMESAVTRAIADGVAQCLKFGVTTVGDISRQCTLSRKLLRDSPLNVVSFGEVQAMAQRRGLLEERIELAVDATEADENLHIAISPHAPYSVEPLGYRRCLEVARTRSLPIATHLAETTDEADFLAQHSGPLRELWDAWLTWDDAVPTFTGGPIRYAQSLGLLDYPTLLAHVNYCDDGELAILAAGKASVVYCPRTHAYFNHAPHRWREMLDRGINVAIGTDSCASSPDLNLVDDLRLLHRLSPDTPVEALWELPTMRAAIAIGLQRDVGSISTGKRAELVAFPIAGDDPLRTILDSSMLPSQVMIGGNIAETHPR